MKKPSKIKAIKAKKAWFLPSGFVAMTLFGVAYCSSRKKADEINKTDGIDNQLESHETIHVRQAESTSNSWFIFYLKYLFQWLHNLPLIFINIHAPYKFMPFELEAYANQDNWGYCLGKCEAWKAYKKLTMKERKKFAMEYFKSPTKIYFTEFIEKRINPELFVKS